MGSFITSNDTSAAFTTKMAGSGTGIGNALAEDVSDFIYMISPTETPLLTMLKKKTASGKTHEWLSDALDSPATNVKNEGTLFESDTIAAKTRYSNPCQISWRAYEVTGTMEAVSQYGVKSELAYQAIKKMKELKLDVNFDLWRNESASGDAAVYSASETEGYHAMAKAQASAHTGNTAYAVAAMTGAAAQVTFNLVLQDIYDGGARATVAFMTPEIKRYVSGWTALGTKYFDQGDRKLVNLIDYYESDFGTIRFIMDRNMEPSAGASDDVLIQAGDFSNAAIAHLRPFNNRKVDVPKDSITGVVLTEYANEYGHPGSYGYMKFST